jgi:ABC-2 type transport system permease protein
MKLLRDTSLIFQRSLQITLRNPVWLFIGIFQPLCFLLFFAPLLEKISATPGFSGNALSVFTPGLLVMMALYGTSFVGFSLIDDIRSGVIERFRVTPISRAALLLGRSLRDVLSLLVQSVILLTCAYFMGLTASWQGVLLSLGLVVLIGLTMSACSYVVALIVQSEDALAPLINFFLLPLQLLAGITLPMTLAPSWLQNVAAFNPLSHAVTAARSLFAGSLTDSTVFWGFGVMLLMASAALFWSINAFNRTVE